MNKRERKKQREKRELIDLNEIKNERQKDRSWSFDNQVNSVLFRFLHIVLLDNFGCYNRTKTRGKEYFRCLISFLYNMNYTNRSMD